MLDQINKHVNDERIRFDEVDHHYFIDGNKAKFSVTEIINKFFPAFDAEYWAERKAVEKLNKEGIAFDSDILQKATQEILKKWEGKRVDASTKGTILHEKIEDFYNTKFHDAYPPEFQYFKNFHEKYTKLKAYRTEWRIYENDLSLAGTIDMVYEKEDGDLFIFDWKRTAKLVDQKGEVILKDFNHGFDKLSHMADNSFNRYSLQQNLYKLILEKNYGKKISSMNLLVLHPDYKNYVHVKLPELKKEAEFLINKAKEMVK